MRCVSCMQPNVGSCLHIQSVSLCLFIGGLNPLNQLLLPVMFDVIFMFVWLTSFGKKINFLPFLVCSFPPFVGVLCSLSFEGLGLWKDNCVNLFLS